MLYHFSENPGIKTFHPHQSDGSPYSVPYVWAIDEEHEVNYFFPRDCPRIIYRMSPGVTEADREKFFGGTESAIIITIENPWLKILNDAVLYRYVLPEENFKLIDKIAGYYISTHDVEPLSVESFDNLPEKIKAKGAELRFTNNLRGLEKEILSSSVKYFSMIRLRNVINN